MARVGKQYDAVSQGRRLPLLGSIAALFGIAMFMQTRIDVGGKALRGPQDNSMKAYGGLNNEFLLLPLLGFREAAAGLLWVRCDEFFHSGDYDAILPLVRLITWLDPHADNVYVTGAWHLAYNFTDSSERSDRRYIGPSQQFLREGVANNMNIPDIKFELGWENYDKIHDFVAAEAAFKMAIAGPKGDEKGTVPDAEGYPYAAPLKTMHVLAHSYEKQGRIPEAIDEWNKALARSAEIKAANKDKVQEFGIKSMHDVEVHNRDLDLQRWRDRYTATKHSDVNLSNHAGVYGLTANGEPHTWDIAFAPQIEVKRPRVLKIYGFTNMADGARIDVRITDWNYQERTIAPVQEKFTVDYSQTILVDSISIRKNEFEREMDMSKDAKMYSFSEPEYKITLSFNSRTTSPHVQDRFGYSGEGMTDSNAKNIVYEREHESLGTKMIDGQGGDGPIWDGETAPWGKFGQPLRMLRVVYKVTKDQMLGNKPITKADIVSSP